MRKTFLLAAAAAWSANAALIPRDPSPAASPTSKPTSWTTGACKEATTTVPALTCASTTATADTATGCACPDGKLYLKLSGGDSGPCHDYIKGQGDLVVPIMTSCPPTTTATTANSEPTEPSYDMAAQFSVTAPPTICTSSDYSYTTKTAIPTGYILLHAGDTGWGPEGSVWNFTTGDNAKLVDMEASCQGSSCTGITGNKQEDGKVKQRKDGSWYMEVTPNMQGSLMVSGLLLDKNTKQFVKSTGKDGRSLRRRRLDTREDKEKKYDLKVKGLPPCGLPVAGNCSNPKFYPDPKQWEAYQVDDFMDSYLKDNKIDSFDKFRKKAMEEFEPKMDSAGKFCDISSPDFNCLAPEWESCNYDSDNHDLVRGIIMTTAVVQYTNYVRTLYSAIETVRGRMGDFIDAIVSNWYVPAAAQQWQKIVSVVGTVLGFVVAGFIILAEFLTAGILGPALIAGAVALQTSVNIAATVGSLKAPDSDDERVKKAGEYKSASQNILDYLQDGLLDTYTKATKDQEVFKTMFKGGTWVDKSIADTFNKEGFGAEVSDFFEHLMISNLINEAMMDNNAYILFVPYSKTKYKGDEWKFNKDVCSNHFTNDPSWNYYAICDVTLGPEGEKGMAVLTRPSEDGNESEEWANHPLNYNGQNITAWDVMTSSMWGFEMHGYNYTLLSNDQIDKVVEAGPRSGDKYFRDIPTNAAGLYRLPVCVVDDLQYVPNIGQVMSDIKDDTSIDIDFKSADDPCPCADYKHKSDDGKDEKFVDFVSDKVKDSVSKDCDVTGGNVDIDSPAD